MMGREVRRVADDWEHPRDEHGVYIPKHDGVALERAQLLYDEALEAWETEEGGAYERRYDGWMLSNMMEDKRNGVTLEEWHGLAPFQDDYMPRWPDAQRTHVQYYESTTEGTPFSPVFATLEELAEWLCGEPEGFDHQQELEFLAANISGERPWD